MAAITFDDLESAKPDKKSSGVITFDDLSAKGPTQRQRDLTTTNARVLRGVVDPIDAGAQMLYNALPSGLVNAVDSANNWLADKTGLVAKVPKRNLSSLVAGKQGGLNQMIADKEAEYQSARNAVGQSGPDWARMGGNVVASLPVGLSAPASAGLGARALYGAATGAAGGALQPVTSGKDFWSEKGNQVATGAAVGGVLAPVAGGVARVIQPKASTNQQLQMLREAGVTPTIGQSIGGWANSLEEKMTSIPIMGDMIAHARRGANEQFNNAAINRALSPVGKQVNGSGQGAIAQAGDILSQGYDDALGKIKGVTLDSQYNSDLASLQQLASGLVPNMKAKFDRTLKNIVDSRISPSGGMTPETYKKIEGELGSIASTYKGSSLASEKDLGSAIEQLKNLLNQNMRRSNPQVAYDLARNDAGWANLVRVEGAGKSAMNNGGVFTPGQLNMAIRGADKSTRKRAVARGEALMQDLGDAGQSVLGNKVPNSFTTDRALIAGGSLGSYLINPAIPAALLSGSLLYTSPAQKAAVSLLADRPEFAGLLANGVRRASPMLGMPLVPATQGLLNN